MKYTVDYHFLIKLSASLEWVNTVPEVEGGGERLRRL